mgnify:CR=1 FL=1
MIFEVKDADPYVDTLDTERDRNKLINSLLMQFRKFALTFDSLSNTSGTRSPLSDFRLITIMGPHHKTIEVHAP